jgi:putative transposase
MILNMGLRFKGQSAGSCFFVTTSFHDRARLGNLDGVYAVLADSLSFCLEKYSATIPGYVFMPSHIHLLLMIEGDLLSVFMRDFKKFIAQKSLPECGWVGDSAWQSGYDRVLISSERVFRRKLAYIHRNPVRAGLCSKEEDWLWSSSRAYADIHGSPVRVWTDWQF